MKCSEREGASNEQMTKKTHSQRESVHSKPLIMPSTASMRNTVDSIASKIGNDTVIPAYILDDPECMLSKCKPYDIIMGRNPFDDEGTATPGGELPGLKAPRGSRRRSRSPLKRRKDVKSEQDTSGTADHDEEFVSVVTPSPVAARLQGRTRPGWAARQLSVEEPYQLLRSRDLETRVRYAPDDDDFEWCLVKGVEPISLQRGFTYLEWAYVSYLIASTMQGTGLPPLSSTNPDDRARRQRRGSAGGAGSPVSDDGVCSVCCKPVELSAVPPDEPVVISDGVHVSQGLRCQECGTCAHLRCWLLGDMPRAPRAWVCDSCAILSQYKRRSAIRCTVCARQGGVLLPYRPALRDDGGGNGSSITATPTSGGDAVCHLVCALALPELSIRLSPTLMRRNGLVNLRSRPCVVPVRRVHKPKCSLRCLHCDHETGSCVQCHHPKCFEAMHAACAAEARTMECYSLVIATASSPTTTTTAAASSLKREGGGNGDFAASAEVPKYLNGVGEANTIPESVLWGGCHVYCPRHFGFTVSNSLGSVALAQRAEEGAMALDLTGLLTAFKSGEEGEREEEEEAACTPVVRRRGRGRPPVAFVQLREMERGLIEVIKAYWLERRQQRRRESAQWAVEINTAHTRPVLTAALRPELIKISASKVRLSHFISLVPEWQQLLVVAVEGELPLPDEEYADVQRYRKASAHTRRSGNTVDLYHKMVAVRDNVDTFCEIGVLMEKGTTLRTEEAALQLRETRASCMWETP